MSPDRQTIMFFASAGILVRKKLKYILTIAANSCVVHLEIEEDKRLLKSYFTLTASGKQRNIDAFLESVSHLTKSL